MRNLKTILFMLLVSSIVHAVIKPADGLWATSDDPAVGSGLMLTTQNGITLVSVFSYDQDGNNAWYIASGQVDDEGVLEAELRQTQNGSNIVVENPETAEFIETVRNLRLEFSGTQVGSMSIDGSDSKDIRPNHFGYAPHYRNPGIKGQWVFASIDTNQSYILNIVDGPFISPGVRPPGYPDFYSSTHPSSSNWGISCFPEGQFQVECVFQTGDSNDSMVLYLSEQDLGNQRMTLTTADGETMFQAHRLNSDIRILPNDGHWRSFDDPAVGSGLVMRTQGNHTLALLYSYDDQGVPTWQIASGVFDENGYFSADLLTPSAGTAIEDETQEAATFSDQVQTLEIQMQGLELATFSIDGSEPKAIQNFNFGVGLYETDNLLINGQPFIFPYLSGNWVFVDHTSETLKSGVLDIEDLSGSISPPPPGAPPVYFGSYYSDDYQLSLTFVCPRFRAKLEADNCMGRVKRGEEISDLIIYFEDIGFGEFRVYSEPASEDGRSAVDLNFFKISN